MDGAKTKGTDLSNERRKNKREIAYKFCRFDEHIAFEEVEALLKDARTVMNGIYGESTMQLDTRVLRDCQERSIYIDGCTFLGQCLAKAFTALLIKAYQPRLFEIQRVLKQENPATAAN